MNRDNDIGEWQIDEHGRRYRMTYGGRVKEYEATITVAGGIQIPESRLQEFNERQKAVNAAIIQKQREQEKALHTGKSCPLGRIECRTDCAMYADGCVMAHFATEGRRCPYNSQKCRKDCGQYKERV